MVAPVWPCSGFGDLNKGGIVTSSTSSPAIDLVYLCCLYSVQLCSSSHPLWQYPVTPYIRSNWAFLSEIEKHHQDLPPSSIPAGSTSFLHAVLQDLCRPGSDGAILTWCPSSVYCFFNQCHKCSNWYPQYVMLSLPLLALLIHGKALWCQSQITSCPLLCLQLPGESSTTQANDCDAVCCP